MNQIKDNFILAQVINNSGPVKKANVQHLEGKQDKGNMTGWKRTERRGREKKKNQDLKNRFNESIPWNHFQMYSIHCS